MHDRSLSIVSALAAAAGLACVAAEGAARTPHAVGLIVWGVGTASGWAAHRETCTDPEAWPVDRAMSRMALWGSMLSVTEALDPATLPWWESVTWAALMCVWAAVLAVPRGWADRGTEVAGHGGAPGATGRSTGAPGAARTGGGIGGRRCGTR